MSDKVLDLLGLQYYDGKIKQYIGEELTSKADASDLADLATTVAGKADESDLTALSTVVSGKADSSALLTKADLVNGLVPAAQLPSYVDDVIEVADYDHLPAEGEAGKIYVTLDDNSCYRWSGSTYIKISTIEAATDAEIDNLLD